MTSSLLKTALTGVDEHTTLVLNFDKMHAQGIATSSLSTRTSRAQCVCIQGEKGELVVEWATYRPEAYTIHTKGPDGHFVGEPKKVEFPIPGHGMFWEADACARALRDGKKEADLCPLSESVLTMQIMDQVRKEGSFSYPEKLEAVRSDA